MLHHFLGAWQSKAPGWGWGWGGGGGKGAAARPGRRSAPHRKALQILSPFVPASWLRDEAAEAAAAAAEADAAAGGSGEAAGAEPPAAAASALFPVSAAFDPPFTVMTRLAGAGDAGGGGEDVGAEITRFGGYQPALLPSRQPSVVEALVGSLGPGASRAGPRQATGAAGAAAAAVGLGNGSDGASRGVFVDVGAGEGFFSLAAAARGHRVIAFESSPPSLEALRASISYNGFGRLIEVVTNVTLGAQRETLCIGQQQQQQQQQAGAGALDAAGSSSNSSSSSSKGSSGRDAPTPEQLHRQRARQRMERRLREDAARLRRGYLHALEVPGGGGSSSGSSSSSSSGGSRARPCAGTRLQRLTLSEFLGARTDVATLRVAAHGHEGWVVSGLLPYLKAVHKPAVIYLEFRPAAMQAAGYIDPAALIWRLRELGYTDAAHAGRVCDARWGNATSALRAGGSFSPAAQMAYHQPTWCKMRPEHFDLVVRGAAREEVPENLLFVLRPHDRVAPPAAAAAKAAAARAEAEAAAARAAARLPKAASSSVGGVAAAGNSTSS